MIRDHSTAEGADALAWVLRRFWLDRGIKINTWIEVTGNPQRKQGQIHCVRSDLTEKWR